MPPVAPSVAPDWLLLLLRDSRPILLLPMAGCLDGIDWRRPDWLDFGEKRNAIASLVSGVLVRRVSEES